MEWHELKHDLLLDPEVKDEYEKIPDPYFKEKYIYIYDDNGNQWPTYIESKKLAEEDTQPMQPIDSSDLAPARGVIKGLLYSLPIWVAAGFVLWAVGKGRWW